MKLDLGDLTLKNRRDLPAYLKSNGVVSMTISSMNNGWLVNTRDKNHKVPYQFLLGNKFVDLSETVELSAENRPLHEKRLVFSFQNKPSPLARAGQYEDIVTVSLYAK